ncbi:alkaline phosphatase family protein [Kribbella sp. NBC_01484]|uniref:alkaline phosphatase family protein n=1 Tax=Kribbella sp. NBC_01484 TaxID=2903579 RepID=UPI002E319A2E|nr:alkaline phosphatase family protein [Kribbella sp. NBC_01484]
MATPLVRTGDLGRIVATYVTSVLALALAAAVLSGLRFTSFQQLLATAAAALLIGALVRPVLVAASAAIGWLAVLLLAFLGQAVILAVALTLIPGVEADSFWVVLAAAWIVAAATTIVAWLCTSGTPEAFTAALVRRTRRRRTPVDDPEAPGVIFVQLDGVPFPVLRWQLLAATLPTVGRWIRDGGYRLVEWTPVLPPTTPASQLGILHGRIDGVPAFRWYDRALGRVLVANRAADAAEIERRASDGRGLLADGGVSISNLFSGDAERSVLTMSKIELKRGSADTRRGVGWYLARPDGFAGSLFGAVAEIARERFEARRQRRRDVRPRGHRGWLFAGMRAVTNVVLRDLNTALVAEEMIRGTRSVYVDYVDYDEVAHHAGCLRPESLAALDRLDHVLACLEEVAAAAPRPYRLVILSDHGQSQGAIFADRYGVDLAAVCAQLTEAQVEAVEQPVEGWGRLNGLLADLSGSDSSRGRAAHGAALRVQRRSAPPTLTAGSDLVVLGSGNLGLVYAAEERRLTMEDINGRWPALIPGLVNHEGISFVAVLSTEHGPLVVGPSGLHRLTDSKVTGDDPLAQFGPLIPADLLRAVSMPEAPDLYVNSSVDQDTGEVSAFEGLVGCHGGLGGWQGRGFLLAPPDLAVPDQPIRGADELHRVLVGYLEQLGQRGGISRDGATQLSPPDRRRLTHRG